MKAENYFDNAATTPVDSRVIREMLPYFETDWGNANSLHAWGRSAMEAVDLARERVAALLAADDSSQIIFTSGATESNNWVLRLHPHAAIGPFEHSAMYEPAKHTPSVTILPNDGLTIRKPDHEYGLISVMSVNNEIGTIFHPRYFAHHCDYLHSDITQAVGKLPIDLMLILYASFSAHKFYGPKGIGALYSFQVPVEPMMVHAFDSRLIRSKVAKDQGRLKLFARFFTLPEALLNVPQKWWKCGECCATINADDRVCAESPKGERGNRTLGVKEATKGFEGSS